MGKRETNGECQSGAGQCTVLCLALTLAPSHRHHGGQEHESPMTLSIIVDTGKDDGRDDAQRRLISARVSLAATIGASASPHTNCTLHAVH